jgi:hypothetical protein
LLEHLSDVAGALSAVGLLRPTNWQKTEGLPMLSITKRTPLVRSAVHSTVDWVGDKLSTSRVAAYFGGCVNYILPFKFNHLGGAETDGEQSMNSPVSWGQIIAAYMPAVILMGTILLGVMSNNRAIARAIDGVHRRIDDTNRRIDERRDDLRNEMRERFDRIDQRLERLEERIQHPIVKGT